MTNRSALITGVAGLDLSEDERIFFAEAKPCGLILFARNCGDHDQIRALIDSVKDAIRSSDLLVLIDQEGGRVQRLRPPLGRALPPASVYAGLYATGRVAALSAARVSARLVAHDLRLLGINTNCAPVLDVPVPGAHDIIGNRAYGAEPEQIAALGRAVAEGYMAGGVLPVIKHIPGHGRALADSHLDLPVVTASHGDLTASDFAPFKLLADMPAAMTAHVVFTAIDPDHPASTSRVVTGRIIRDEIGFDGLLMSDDLSMKALTGDMRSRALAVIAAGSDVALHCNGDLSEMQAAASGVPSLAGAALKRFAAALAVTEIVEPFDQLSAETVLAGVLGEMRTGNPQATESV